MRKNSILFIILSLFTILFWYLFISPNHQRGKHYKQTKDYLPNQEHVVINNHVFNDSDINKQYYYDTNENINIETDKYKAILTRRGGAILSWLIKEKNGQLTDLVVKDSIPVMENFSNEVYDVVSRSNNKVIFEHVFANKCKIIKTYNFSNSYMHNLNFSIERPANAHFKEISFKWGPGIGIDTKDIKENNATTKISAYNALAIKNKLEKLKNVSKSTALYKWVAIDNKYFLAAFIPANFSDFDKITSFRISKKHPYCLSFTAIIPKNVDKKDYSIDFYLGPKNYKHLQTYRLGLEKTIDFGFFGFLGKIAFIVLTFFYRITNNYGWAIIMLTTAIQILVLPLTLKSFKSAESMKNIQPMINDIQVKYKDDPRRLQMEILNLYRKKKVNPLGGCLPMILQLPIFWAFFTMLRNVYELRNEKWIFWIKDLSVADNFMNIGSFSFNLLPLIMAITMFFQQKTMATNSSDKTQKKMVYIMPIVFMFMFWSFPAGLIMYWITSSIISIIEQYFVMKNNACEHM